MSKAIFTMKLEAELRDRFMEAAAASHRPASQIVREFMRSYVTQQQHRAFAAEARRQSEAIAERARDPATDEYAMMREIEAELDQETGT